MNNDTRKLLRDVAFELSGSAKAVCLRKGKLETVFGHQLALAITQALDHLESTERAFEHMRDTEHARDSQAALTGLLANYKGNRLDDRNEIIGNMAKVSLDLADAMADERKKRLLNER